MVNGLEAIECMELAEMLRSYAGESSDESRRSAYYAAARILDGLRYGEDMESSRMVCFRDAVSLLNDAMRSRPKPGDFTEDDIPF
jgi:hypothetical protein